MSSKESPKEICWGADSGRKHIKRSNQKEEAVSHSFLCNRLLFAVSLLTNRRTKRNRTPRACETLCGDVALEYPNRYIKINVLMCLSACQWGFVKSSRASWDVMDCPLAEQNYSLKPCCNHAGFLLFIYFQLCSSKWPTFCLHECMAPHGFLTS